jgi:hypothetical protein
MLAVQITSIGALLDQPNLIVGAIVPGPDFGPVTPSPADSVYGSSRPCWMTRPLNSIIIHPDRSSPPHRNHTRRENGELGASARRAGDR